MISYRIIYNIIYKTTEWYYRFKKVGRKECRYNFSQRLPNPDRYLKTILDVPV